MARAFALVMLRCGLPRIGIIFYNRDKGGTFMDSKENTVTYFSGLCSRCAERYEAHSATDNLEGISFSCKKMICSGNVILKMDRLGSHMKGIETPFSLDPKSDRYC